MPRHDVFFPEKPSKDKTVNRTISVPNPPVPPPITIKCKSRIPKPVLFKWSQSNNDNHPKKPVITAPNTKVKSMAGSFFGLY